MLASFIANFFHSDHFSDAKNASGGIIETNPSSAATITKRPLKVVNQSETSVQIENSKKLKLAAEALTTLTTAGEKSDRVPETFGSDENAIAKRPASDLPTFEEYEALKAGRSPYFCVACEKSFTRTSIK